MDEMKNFVPVSRIAHSSWRTAALVATRGNQTFTGCLLIAVLGKAASNPPRIIGGAEIDGNGGVWAPWQGQGSAINKASVRKLCDIQELIDRFRWLADHLKLSDTERQEMFTELKMWVTVDHRPRKEWDYARAEHA